MKRFKTQMNALLFTVAVAGLVANDVNAASDGRWFLRPVVGLSMVSDFQGTANSISGFSGPADIRLDNGFNAGLGVGYRYNSNLAVELAWEYRSNDSEVITDGGTSLGTGNYASNTFFLNGFYFFNQTAQWQPYLGAGLSWVQEIDLDFEQSGVESSFSSDGDVGYQVFAGLSYKLTPDWALQTELRYGSITNITLESESGNGSRFTGMEYQPFTVQLGLSYQF